MLQNNADQDKTEMYRIKHKLLKVDPAYMWQLADMNRYLNSVTL